MYDILNVVYGFPYTKEVEKAAAALAGCSPSEFDPDTLEPSEGGGEEPAWVFLYSGSADFIPGFFGVFLDEMPSWESTPARAAPTPPPEVVEKVNEAFSHLPVEIRVAAPQIDVYHVWSTS